MKAIKNTKGEIMNNNKRKKKLKNKWNFHLKEINFTNKKQTDKGK